MDPSPLAEVPLELEAPLEPDEPFYDILHDIDVVAGIRAFLAKEQLYFDAELLAADQSASLWVRVTPTLCSPNADFADNWLIEDGMCQRLNSDGRPEGPVGSCNGYFTTIESPGHTVGKLNINIP